MEAKETEINFSQEGDINSANLQNTSAGYLQFNNRFFVSQIRDSFESSKLPGESLKNSIEQLNKIIRNTSLPFEERNAAYKMRQRLQEQMLNQVQVVQEVNEVGINNVYNVFNVGGKIVTAIGLIVSMAEKNIHEAGLKLIVRSGVVNGELKLLQIATVKKVSGAPKHFWRAKVPLKGMGKWTGRFSMAASLGLAAYDFTTGNIKSGIWNLADAVMGVVSAAQPEIGVIYFGLRMLPWDTNMQSLSENFSIVPNDFRTNFQSPQVNSNVNSWSNQNWDIGASF